MHIFLVPSHFVDEIFVERLHLLVFRKFLVRELSGFTAFHVQHLRLRGFLLHQFLHFSRFINGGVVDSSFLTHHFTLTPQLLPIVVDNFGSTG